MFKEWKAIFKKPTFIIVMIGISLIPALYNIIFLSSMWDPYGQLSDLPVAVVNNDKEASYNGNTMAIGKDMVSNLKENKTLDFHFVDEEEGKKGLEDGDYYMVVTLPSDLSEKAASILTDHPEQMQIDYQTSSGHSFIASKMSDSAMTQLKQNVSTNVTETYTKALFNKMIDLKDGMSQAASGSEKLTDGANQLVTGSQTLTTNLHSLADSSLTFSNGTEQFTKGLSSYVSGVEQLHLGLGNFNSGLVTYTGAVSQLDRGLGQLAEKTPELVSGIEKLSTGSNQLNQKSQELIAGVDKLQSGSSQLADKSSQLISGASQLESGANKLADGAGKLAEGGTKLTSGLEGLQTGVASLGQGLSNASDQLKSASTESQNAEILSNPLSLSKTDNDQVPVNGIAMAPYMISVALFVAAISTNMIFAKLPSGRHPESRWAWLKSRAEINGIIAVLAGILVYGGVHLIGLTANHEMRTFILIILTSLVFMSMVTALTTWNSRIGAFFSLILLLLQLASSAGTYPLALTNDFFRAINPWLPMSYSVSGLRQTISMTGNIHHQVIFLAVILVLFTGLGMLAYQPKKMEED